VGRALQHVEFVKARDAKPVGGGGTSRWDVYVRKVGLQAHDVAPTENTMSFGVWQRHAAQDLKALDVAGVPILRAGSSEKAGTVLGKEVKVSVDWGLFPFLSGEVTPYSVTSRSTT